VVGKDYLEIVSNLIDVYDLFCVFLNPASSSVRLVLIYLGCLTQSMLKIVEKLFGVQLYFSLGFVGLSVNCIMVSLLDFPLCRLLSSRPVQSKFEITRFENF